MGIFSLLTGCAAPANPSFSTTISQANNEILRMHREPRPVPRPIVIIGGYMDPMFMQTIASQYFRTVIPDAKIITVSLLNCGSFEECKQRILAAVNEACGPGTPGWTAEVDVVGISLGGLAARAAAAPPQDPMNPQRLRIARLYTISSPLAGARVAKLGFTTFQKEIRPQSALQQYLAAAEPNPSYEIVSYVHLGDEMVGVENAALPGRTPYWIPNMLLPVMPPHEQIMVDPRVYADIALRLRGETPLTLSTPAPLPKN